MAAPILWTPGKIRPFCRKNHVHRIPRFRGGGILGFWGGGGGSADSIFMGARIFHTNGQVLARPISTAFLWLFGSLNCSWMSRSSSGQSFSLLFQQKRGEKKPQTKKKEKGVFQTVLINCNGCPYGFNCRGSRGAPKKSRGPKTHPKSRNTKQTVKCKPWTERVVEKGLTRGVSRAAWKRHILTVN